MASNTVEIKNEFGGKRLSLIKWKKITAQILKILGWEKAVLSVLFVNDRKIREINKKYLKHDRPTDVIAFSHLEGKKLKIKDRQSGPIHIGDLVISLETTEKQAKEYENRFEYELAFYLCHGILHLMGYGDHTQKAAALMDRKQKQILKKMGIRN